ncbi:GNAT family N-acetyltransferase [Aquimarina litoralis]|uniref:GNAT family N-acetyltransferase n=1 Tax=Aquimarina litoralis TaxID=584605 RepID=UPI001C5A0F75|nr:GNAT family N-acetyltransferase [Aquimarina litoralis]
MKKQHIDYFFELFEKCSIPKIFSGVLSEGSNEVLKNQNHDPSLIESPSTIYSVFFIPDYLKPNLDDTNFVVKKVPQFFKGYAIFLDGFSNADAYIKHRFRSNAKGIRRRIKRLENCFNISYKTYYGSIDQNEYDQYMDQLEQMLVRRFEQRNDVSQSLLRWDYYKKMYFSLINEKKASMFVAFDGDQPIIISLNHHFENRLFSAISSYDIDYSKFSLGSVEIYKKLDWLIENDHVSYEMGMGDLSYKREWCNHIYNFEHQIIYPKKSFIGAIKGNIEYCKVLLKEFVFKIAYVRYKKYKAKRKEVSQTPSIRYEVSPIEDLKYDENLEIIDYNSVEYKELRRKVFDFLYTSIDKVSNVRVVALSEQKKSFLILGTSKMQKVDIR